MPQSSYSCPLIVVVYLGVSPKCQNVFYLRGGLRQCDIDKLTRFCSNILNLFVRVFVVVSHFKKRFIFADKTLNYPYHNIFLISANLFIEDVFCVDMRCCDVNVT